MEDKSNSLESGGSEGSGTQTAPPPAPAPPKQPAPGKKPNVFKVFWKWLALDPVTLMLMFKSAVAPTVSIAIYQSRSVRSVYGALGYLVAIISLLSFPSHPRAIYLHKMVYQVGLILFACAVCYFQVWTAIKARDISGLPPGLYNSSQAAVCGAWLFLHMWFANMLRAWKPELQFPGILYSIYVIVAFTYGSIFPNIDYMITFFDTLLEAFLTGFAISAATSLLIFPINCRMVVFKEFDGYLRLLRGILQAEGAYLSALENLDAPDGQISGEKSKSLAARVRPQTQMLKGLCLKIYTLHGALSQHLTFAKRETAFGKMSAHDLDETFHRLRRALLPIVGMSSVIDIFGRISEIQGWQETHAKEANIADPDDEHALHELNNTMATIHGPFAQVAKAMDGALHHVLLVLEFEKRPKKKAGEADVESKAGAVNPGDPGYAAVYESKAREFFEQRHMTLDQWCEKHGMGSAEHTWAKVMEEDHTTFNVSDLAQRQIFVILYMEYLLYSASKRVLELVQFADSKVEDGTMAKNKLIKPNMQILKKWFWAIVTVGDGEGDQDSMSFDKDGTKDYYFGEAFQRKKDPEHLPPTTLLQRAGNQLRKIPKLLRSAPSAFGFRAAVAVMSIAIMAFIHQTFMFFIRQRVLWSLIMIGFSMSPTSGRSLFNFILRATGTLLSMIGAYIIWYIVDEHIAGAIVFLFLWIFLLFYEVVKFPKYATIGLISSISAILIIGYEIQVKTVGIEASEASGQPAYATYKLAPYRLLAVVAGLTVAYIWTVFPYPLSEHSALRKDLGGALYLLANYYSVSHETILARVRGDEGDLSSPTSPGHRLELARVKVFSRSQLLISGMRQSSEYTKWQVHVGGRFPKETYDEILTLIHSILNYASLLCYASESFSSKDSSLSDDKNEWLQDFKKLLHATNTTTHEVTSLLALLSNAILHGQPLPPYLKTPRPYQLVKQLERIDKDILGVRHIAEPGYAAFAVMQVTSNIIMMDLDKLTKLIKSLVGELDFSFHAISTAQGEQHDGSANAHAHAHAHASETVKGKQA